jgi:hypothetical protein
MDRFVAHCVATALITAALAAASTVRAESSGAEAAPPQTAQAAAAARFPAGMPVGATESAADALLPAVPAKGVSVPLIPAPAGSVPIGSPPAAGGIDAAVQAGAGKGTVCADAYQVGSTVYAHWHGEIIFSVKQYYSPRCHTRYSYAFPWLQFRESDASYDIGLAVLNLTHDELDGAVTYVNGIGSPNYWSAPVRATPGSCTEATVHLFLPDDETDTYTQKFCL